MNEANTPPITLPATLVRRQGGDKGESKGVNKRTLHRVSWGLGRQDHTNHVFKDGYKGEGLEQHKGEDVGTQLRKEMKQKTRNDGARGNGEIRITARTWRQARKSGRGNSGWAHWNGSLAKDTAATLQTLRLRHSCLIFQISYTLNRLVLVNVPFLLRNFRFFKHKTFIIIMHVVNSH